MADHIIDKIEYDSEVYKFQDNVSGYTTNAGTVTSVQVQATSPVQSSTSTEQTGSLNTTISLADAYGDTKNPYGTKSANYVLAGPSSGTASAPTFRALATSDIPDLSGAYLPLTGGSVTGDITLQADAATNSKSLIFQRGTLSDNYNDWMIQDRGGYLYFDERGSGSSAWTNRVMFNTTGNVQATSFNGYYLQPATYNTTSLIKPWFSTTGASTLASGSSTAYSDTPTVNARTTTAGRYYALEIDKNGRAYTNVPWESGSSGLTSVGLANDTNGGLSISGSPLTSNGTITIGHSNVLANAQTTEAVYPIAIDKNGHISSYGNAVTIPTVPTLLIGNTSSITPTQVVTALQNNQNIYITHAIDIDQSIVATYFDYAPTMGLLVSNIVVYYGNKYWLYTLSGNTNNDTWAVASTELAQATDIPSVPTGANNNTTGISIADHSTTTIYGVTSSTTSVTGVQPTTTSVRGVKTGTNSTTTASKVTLGTAISVPNVTSAGSASNWVFEDITVPIRADSATSIPNVTSVGSASTWAFGDVTVPIRADSDTTVPIKNTSATSIPNVTAVGSGSFTQGSFDGGSFTQGVDSFTANTPTTIDTSKFNGGSGSFTQGSFSGGSGSFSATVTNHVLSFSHTHTAATHGADSHTHNSASLSTGFYSVGTAASFTQGEDSFTPATHGADSHTHTPPTLGTAISVTGVQSSTTSVRGVKTGTSSTTTASHVTSGSNGTAPTLGTAITIYGVKSGTNSTTTASHVKSGGNGTAPTLGTAISVPNVTGATDVTVPIRADADTTVPIKNESATTVPIKDSSSTTVVTGKTHTITDNGHTHTLS